MFEPIVKTMKQLGSALQPKPNGQQAVTKKQQDKPTKTAQKQRPGDIGQQKEQHAENFLSRQGLISIEKNYRCKAGEIDLVMRDGDYLVFVEVRFRRSIAFGSAAESIDFRKQQKLLKAAQHYLQQRQLTDTQPCRFDTLCIQGTGATQTFDWIKNALA